MSTNKPEANETKPVDNTTTAETETTAKKKPNRKRLAIIITASVAAVALAACAGVGVWRNQNVQALQQECSKVTAQVKTEEKSLAELVKSDDVVKALKVSDKQLLDTDKKTLSTLKDTVESASEKVTVPACEVDFFAFDANPAESARGVLKTVQGKATAVEEATANVNKAVAAKTLSDAKDKLKKTVESANKLLSDSDGKVQDNATRDNLSRALDAAKKILDDKKNTDLKKLSTKTVDDAVNAVNASMEAKRQADEQAAQAAAQAAAAAAQRAYTPQNTYNGNSYSGGNSGGSSSSNVGSLTNSWGNTAANSGRNIDPDTGIDLTSSGEMPCQVVGTCQTTQPIEAQ